jgi:cell division protease FtsH
MNISSNHTVNPEQIKRDQSFFQIICFIWLFLIFYSHFNKLLNNTPTEKKELTIIIPNKENQDPTLHKIVGLESVKEEIKYYMDFINNKDKYIAWDVKLPKGILLAGPPGTGKTLLVKTLANSLNIPIISCSGSEFVEVYVGLGASRIRNIFKKAKEYEKCIIFIDEIDAIGKKRGYDNNSERDNTLNQLLVEMDGFSDSNNIIVFAATNMVRKLDNKVWKI